VLSRQSKVSRLLLDEIARFICAGVKQNHSITAQESMMIKKYQLLLLLPVLFIGGCSSGEDETAQTQSSKEHVFSDQARALEKAKGVEQVIQSGADKQRQAIEEQSQ
jgi:hypothetical protein